MRPKDPTKIKDIENAHIQIKKYDSNSPTIQSLPPLSADIKIKDINEDFPFKKLQI